MKTKFFSMFAVAAMLLTTSCSNDETNELISGEPVTTSFKVQLPNSIGTRPNKGAKKAFADGMTATKLKYMLCAISRIHSVHHGSCWMKTRKT